jgi:hypothetical protein
VGSNPKARFADHRLAISLGTDPPFLACEVID